MPLVWFHESVISFSANNQRVYCPSSGCIISKYAVNVVIDFIYVMMDGFLADLSPKLFLSQVIFVALHEMLIHRGWRLVLQVVIDLHPTAFCDFRFINFDVLVERSQVADEVKI